MEDTESECDVQVKVNIFSQKWPPRRQSVCPVDFTSFVKVRYRGALYKKLRFINVRNVGTNLGVGTFTWIFMV